jgi:hypothetical protein
MADVGATMYGALKQLEIFGNHNVTMAEYNVLDIISAWFTNLVFMAHEQMADIFQRRLASLFPSDCVFSLASQRREEELWNCGILKPHQTMGSGTRRVIREISGSQKFWIHMCR